MTSIIFVKRDHRSSTPILIINENIQIKRYNYFENLDDFFIIIVIKICVYFLQNLKVRRQNAWWLTFSRCDTHIRKVFYVIIAYKSLKKIFNVIFISFNNVTPSLFHLISLCFSLMAAFSHKQTGNPISHQAISPRKYNMFGSQLR